MKSPRSTPDILDEEPVLPPAPDDAPPPLRVSAAIAALSVPAEFEAYDTRRAFIRARNLLALDLDRLWTGTFGRLGGEAGDELVVAELWLCLTAIEDGYRRDADNEESALLWAQTATARAHVFGTAARAVEQLISPDLLELLTPLVVAEDLVQKDVADHFREIDKPQ